MMSLNIQSNLNNKNDLNNKLTQRKKDVAETLVSENANRTPDNRTLDNRTLNNMGDIAQKIVSQEEILELMRQFDMVDDENIMDPKVQARQTEEQAKIAAAKAKIRRELSYAADNISKSAVSELISSGLSLEKISLNILNSVIKEIDEKPETEIFENNAKEITDKLSGAEMSDESIAVLLKSGKKLSLENIYKAKFSAGNGKTAADFDEGAWKKLEPSVEKIFEEQGIEKNADNIENAKFLFANKIPITKQNIDKTQFLKNLSENIGKLEKSEKLADDVSKIKGETVNIVLKKQIPLTLNNLITENARQSGTAEETAPANSENAEDLSVPLITARRQLAEIQLKLTKQAAYALADNKIEIDTLPLENALNELRKVESEGFAKNLRIMNAPVTPQNTEKMSGLFSALSSFKALSNSVYGDLILKKAEFTIDGIENSFKLSKTIGDLELFATVANPKYGDSFQKIRRQIAPLLEALNIPATDSNIKAASILSKNKIDVTAENIKNVSVIDSKINRIANTLHPNIAAQMVKEGLDPKYMHIDDVQKYIDTFNGKYGEDLGEKIARYILETGNQDIDDKTRQSMMDIYKMLNRVQKNESAAIGVMYKNGIDLTLEKLVQASGYFAKTRGGREMIDISVDRTVGERVNFEYNSQRVRDFAENSAPPKLSAVITEQEDILTQNLDEVIASLKSVEAEIDKEMTARRINETVQSLAKTPVEIISRLSESGYDLAIRNIIAQKNVLGKDTEKKMDKIEEIRENENDGKRALQIKKLQANINFHKLLNTKADGGLVSEDKR